MRTVGLVAAIAFAVSPGTTQGTGGIARLSWLQGCWQAVSGERTVEEQWMAPRGRSMVGISRTVRGDALVGYELVVVQEEGDRVSYQAHPSGQPSAVFVSKLIAEETVVFENPQHDFPQRIGYQRKGADLLAWIEGAQGGQARRIEFPYRRVACAGS